MPTTGPGRARFRLALLCLLTLVSGSLGAAEREAPPPGKTTAEVLEASKPSDWRSLDLERTLYVTLPGGRVVIELAPDFAPRHVANIRTLARQGTYDDFAVVRSQDNYVVQWGDPAAGDEVAEPAGEETPDGAEAGEGPRSLGEAEASLPPEWERPIDRDGEGEAEPLPLTPLPDGDVYAPEVGFSLGFPVGHDPGTGRIWLTHCYGMVGAGRAMAADSGNGSELYVVIGHAPRHLDKNVTLVGRVVDGVEVLSTLPRGTGDLGFYEDSSEHVPIGSIRLGSQLPEEERAHLELLRTDTDTFRDLIDARRWRREEWFLDPVGAVGLCNVPLPVRPVRSADSDGVETPKSAR